MQDGTSDGEAVKRSFQLIWLCLNRATIAITILFHEFLSAQKKHSNAFSHITNPIIFICYQK